MTVSIFIDPTRCIGCKACEVACEREHNGVSHIKVSIIEEMSTAMAFNCRHCENAPCVKVCPVDALYRDESGAVILRPLRCIGCMMCAIVCPFGIPELDQVNKIMMKCDLCEERRKEGKLPVCVTTCPTDTLLFGDINEIMEKKREKVVLEAVRIIRSFGEEPKTKIG